MYLKAALPPIPEEMTYNHHPLDHCKFVAASAVIYWYLHGWFFLGHRILEHILFNNGFIQPWLYIGNICLLVSVCSLWTLSPALAVPSTKNPALRELDEHLQINLRQTSKAEQCWKALSMIAEILLPLLLYDIVWYIYNIIIIIIIIVS